VRSLGLGLGLGQGGSLEEGWHGWEDERTGRTSGLEIVGMGLGLGLS
jgi:hypothetical protein